MKAIKLLFVAFSPVLAFGAVTIPSGADIEINTGNLSDYASGIAFADATGVVRFNLPSAPTMSVTGAGTLIKTSSADWTMTMSISGFTGDYILSGSGVVSSGIANAFGSAGNNTYAHSLTVSNGATLSVTASVKDLLGYRVLVLNGRGAGGRGALEVPEYIYTDEAIRHIRLGSDARISLVNGRYLFLAATGRGLDLNGHRLELTGKGYIYDFGKLSGEGEVVVQGNDGGYVDFSARDIYFGADPSETSPIVLNNHARLNFYNAAKRIERPLWVCGTDNAVYHNEQWPDRNPNYTWKTNIVAVGGPVVFTNETGMSNLRVYNSFARRLLTLAGSITGHGSVSVTASNVGGVRFEGANSTFDGGLYVSGQNGGQFQAMCPGSVGAYASVTGDYGHIDADFSTEDGDGRWGWSDYVDFAKKATWLNGAFPLLDARLADEPPVLDATLAEGVMSLGVAGESVLTNAENLAAGFVWHAGRTKLVSSTTLDWSDGIGIATASLCTNPVPGQIVLDDGIRVETDAGAVRVGGYEEKSAPETARLVVKRATLVNRHPETSVFTSATNAALVVGGSPSGRGTGVLEIHDGAVITNKLLVGGWESTIDPVKSRGSGGVWQMGGEMAVLGTSASHQLGSGLGLDAASQGGYELWGGRFVSLGSFQTGYYGYGVWSQYGGYALFTNELGSTANRYHFIGSGNGGKGSFYLRGGQVDTYGDVYINASGHGTIAGWGHLAIAGPLARYCVCNGTIILNPNGANAKGNASLEVNCGGVLSVRSIATNGRDVREGYVSFDGGTYKRVSDSNPKDLFYGDTTRPTRLTVYSGGMSVDTDGHVGISLGADIQGPHGKGVVAVPLEKPIVDSRLVAAPLVQITGDGHGASAVAEFDPISGAVTNIVVTAAGWDYETAPSVKLIVAGSTIATLTATIAEIPNTGSFTKAGAGDLTVFGSNTYGGATILAGGVLKLGSDGALPDGTKIELAGGTIDAGSFVETLPLVWEVDALKALAAGGIVYDGNLAFPAGSTLRVLNLGSVPEECSRLEVLKVTGTLSGSPTVVDVDGTGRNLRLTAHGLKASVPTGMCIIFR